jgi:hypothetical protein
LAVRQLLRRLAQRLEEGGDVATGLFHPWRLGMGMADGEAHLAGMTPHQGRGMEMGWPAGDGLGVLIRVGQAVEEAPPVVDLTINHIFNLAGCGDQG